MAELVDLSADRQARFLKGLTSNSTYTIFFSMYHVYAISSQVKRYIYVGLTSNLEERLRRHNKGYEQTTKAYRPFKLIYKEECDTRIEARQREKYFKSGTGKEFLKSLE